MTTEELQKLFGPNVLELTERKYHYCTGPCLVVKKGLTQEEHREISKKFQDWRHQIFLESIGLKNDEEYHDWVYRRGKFSWWKRLINKLINKNYESKHRRSRSKIVGKSH